MFSARCVKNTNTEAMPKKGFTIQDQQGNTIKITVRRDKRLKKTSRWQWESKENILLRVPYRLPNRAIQEIIGQIEGQLEKRSRLAQRRTDPDLQRRAEHINRKYFEGQIEWRAIRWVGNMNTRLGSCTTGGPTDGHIRISERIQHWPQWVIDYVIAHELVHRLYANHSPEFWQRLTNGYPLAERARGFIQGAGFAEGTQFEED